MRYAVLSICASALSLLAGCGASQSATTCPEPTPIEAPFAESQSQIATRAEEIAWGPCPPALPAGCEMSVLEGDPRKEVLFTARFRISSAFEMPPHWHPRNERVTILEGKVGVGFGDEIDREKVSWFGPGDYYVNASGAHHFVLGEQAAVLQITGIGPWKAIYLDAE